MQKIDKEVDLKGSSKNVLTARRDGTTERLNAIVHGFHISKLIDWPFKFSWVKDIGAITNPMLLMENSLPSFFKKDFVEKHFIEFDEFIGKYKLDGVGSPMCEYVSGTEFRKIPNSVDLKDVVNVIPASGLDNVKDLPPPTTVESVISDCYFEYMKEHKNSLSETVAIHYRGGDVIYGINRHGVHAVGNKAVPLRLVEDLISCNKNTKFLIFGTPLGETLSDMKFLEDKYPNASLASGYSTKELDHIIQDCFLMAACKEVVSMSGTGVTRFASLISPSLKKRFFNRIYEGEKLFSLLMEGAKCDDYNSKSRAYHAVRALHIKPENEKVLLPLIKSLDSENRLDWLKNNI